MKREKFELTVPESMHTINDLEEARRISPGLVAGRLSQEELGDLLRKPLPEGIDIKYNGKDKLNGRWYIPLIKNIGRAIYHFFKA